MAKFLLLSLAVVWSGALGAAERVFDFSLMPENKPPPGFRSAVAGEGKPGDWKVILDDVPPLLAPFSPESPVVTKQAVLGQLAKDSTDEHFALLIFEGESFGDFTLTTRFKIVSGDVEQMAGIAFRLQDERNFYVIRASALGNNVRFYKLVNGQRSTPIGPEVKVPKGVWQELTVECRGNQIRCLLNGKEAFPALADSSFMRGRIAFWTKSDSVSYFTGTRITYVPQEMPAQAMVRDVLKDYPRLVGIRIFSRSGTPSEIKVIASNDAKEVGTPGGDNERDVLEKNSIFYGKDAEKGTVSTTMPLRDRNGDAVAVVKLIMQSFPGQTEQNAFSRARPIMKKLQSRVQNASDLTD